MERKLISLLIVLSILSGGVLAAGGDADHAEDTNTAQETPPAKTETKPAAAPDPAAKDQNISRPEALVRAVQGMKLSRQATAELQLLMEKNPDLNPKQFNEVVDILAQQEPGLLTDEQIQGLKELFRVELTNVQKERSGEMAKALKTVLAKLPPVPGKPGEAIANAAAAAAGTTPAAGAGGKAAPDLAKAFSEQLSKVTAAQQASLGQVLDGAKALLTNLQKAAQEKAEKGDPNKLNQDLLAKLRDLEKGRDDKNGKNDRDLGSKNNASNQPPPSNNSGGDDKKDSDSKKNDRLLDFLKNRDKDKEKKGGAPAQQQSQGEKKDDKKEKKDEQKNDFSFKKRDDEPPPPPKKKKPIPTPTPTPPPEPPVVMAPPPPIEKSPLNPIPNQGGGFPDSGTFNFGGSAMPSGGGAAPLPGGTAFDGGVFNVGQDFGGYGGGGGGRFAFGKPVGYAGGGDVGGGDEVEETVDGGGGNEESPRSRGRRGKVAQEIVMTPTPEGPTSAITMIGTLGRKLCDDVEGEVGVCETMKARRQRRIISQDRLAR